MTVAGKVAHMSVGTDDEHGVVTERLVALYRRYLGEPGQLSDVYVGFGLFFGGVAFGVVGVVVFFWSATLAGQPGYWQLREVAIALSMLGLPAFLTSVVVLLPSDRRAEVAAGAGATVCLIAVGIFVANYPRNWNAPGADASTLGVAVYALGVVVATAAVGASLVSNYVARTESEPTVEEADSTDDAEAVTDEDVRADIEAAMDGVDLSWGGVERDDTKRLTVRPGDEDVERAGLDPDNATEYRAESGDVDDAVDGLQQLRGGSVEEDTSDGVDDQADALRQVRERQAADAETDDRGLLARLREWLGV
jgi:hypothetical protein